MNGEPEEADPLPPPPPEAWGGIATAQAIGDLGSDPDEAARSFRLAKMTGVPAPVIQADPEGFDRQQKTRLASQLISRNPFLQQYINQNPEASKVSNDDYG